MKVIQCVLLLSVWVNANADAMYSNHCVSAMVPIPSFVPAHTGKATRRDGDVTKVNLSSASIDVGRPFPNADKTVQQLRDELKTRLLFAADDFASMKSKADKLALKAQEIDEQMKKEKWFVVRLLNKILKKISRAQTSKNASPSQSRGILTSDSFSQVKLDVGEAGEKVIALAEQLSQLNPTPIPTLGFKNYGGAPSTESKLAGRWKLRFTTAADASFSESKERGAITTSQVIDAEKGTLTNVIDFEKGSLTGFRVVVQGEPSSETMIDLFFKSVTILRKSNFPRLFGQFKIWLPSRLIRWLASKRSHGGDRDHSGPYLELRYLDENLRMHTTDQGNWFIQSRLNSA
jgi:hypothetical protein